jgi:hypothetical protein
MKKPETFHQPPKNSALTRFSRAGVKFIIAACAAIAVCFALTSQASNLLVNPGFDDPTFDGWSAHTTESWSYATHTDSYISPPNDLWQQGLYGNGASPTSGYVSYVYQSFPTAPGYSYKADANFSQYVQFFGFPGTTVEGGDNGNARVSVGGGTGLFNNNDTGSYYEDGWVEVAFLNAASFGTNGTAANTVAVYRSKIIDPTFENTISNNVFFVVVPNSSNTNFLGQTVTNVVLNWMDFSVTNQYDPTTIADNQDPSPNDTYLRTPATTPTITNTLSNGVMVAPPGAAYVQFRLSLYQLSFASGAPHWDDCTLNQVSGQLPDSISAITPSSGVFLTNTSFSFNVNTPSPGVTTPTNAIKVVVNGLDQSSSLQFSGNNTNWNVTLPGLTSNVVYNIAITATNTATLLTTASAKFDTFGPGNFVVPAETYDYYSGSSGQFIQNPVPSTNAGPTSYWGLSGIPATDYFIAPGAGVSGGGGNLQPGYPNRGTNTDAAWQIPNDPQMPLYIAQGAPTSGVYNVTIAYNNPTDWFNYTRTYPSGAYLVYARMSSGNGAGGGVNGTSGGEYLNLQLTGHGTSSSTYTNIGIFAPTINTDWNTYYWYPLTDGNGNQLIVTVPPGQQTLQLVSAGNCNLSYFMFAPLPPLGLPPAINNLNPALTTGGNVFVSTNKITFNVSSYNNTIATSNIHTYLNGTDVSASQTFTGSSSNWAVTVPLSVPANQNNQTFAIGVKDSNGLTNGVSGTFDTFSQANYMIEAEDYDFNGGVWIDNPLPTAGTTAVPGVTLTNSYFYWAGGNQLYYAVSAIDNNFPSNTIPGETLLYRGLIPTFPANEIEVGTEVTSDFLRNKFYNTGQVPGEGLGATNQDYDVGWWGNGTWINYTRTFPAGTYQVWGRLAFGGAYTNCTLGLVPAAQRGQLNNTAVTLGHFDDLNANGFQSWHWIELMSNGAPAVLTLGGMETLKLTSAINGPNANFYMFVPYVVATAPHLTVSRAGSTISIMFPTQSGHSYVVQWTGSLSGTPSWTTLTTIAGDGTVKTATDTVSPAQRYYRVQVN